MNKTFNLLFYVKKSKINSNGTAQIYLRITINGSVKEIAVKRYIEPEKWNSQAQKCNGNSEETKNINAYLKTFEIEVLEAQHFLQKDKQVVTPETLKSKLLGTGSERPRTIVPIFQDHNNKMKALLQVEFAPGTLQLFDTTLKYVKGFLKWKNDVNDIDIKKMIIVS